MKTQRDTKTSERETAHLDMHKKKQKRHREEEIDTRMTDTDDGHGWQSDQV